MAVQASARLVLDSEIRLVDVAHQAAEKMAQLAGFNSADALNLGLAVREATINAIVHGNRKDPRLKVRITLTAMENELRIKVRDQGSGFDPTATPDPTAEANLLRTSGRGLLLMRAFVDQVKIRNHGAGMEVTLVKRRRVRRAGAADRRASRVD